MDELHIKAQAYIAVESAFAQAAKLWSSGWSLLSKSQKRSAASEQLVRKFATGHVEAEIMVQAFRDLGNLEFDQSSYLQRDRSDIIALLDRLGQKLNDSTCHALRVHASRGEDILNVCYDAIEALATEKHAYLKKVIDAEMLRPPPAIILSTDGRLL